MSDKHISAEALTISLRDDPNLNAASFARVKRHIEDAPDMVKRGQWLYDSGDGRHFCSACNEKALSVTYEERVADYDWEENLVFRMEVVTKEFWTDCCPNCGADMRGEEDA